MSKKEFVISWGFLTLLVGVLIYVVYFAITYEGEQLTLEIYEVNDLDVYLLNEAEEKVYRIVMKKYDSIIERFKEGEKIKVRYFDDTILFYGTIKYNGNEYTIYEE